MNLRRFGRALVMSLTTVDVQNGSSRDKLKELTGQLLCQEDARCHHHNSLRSIGLKLTQSIKDGNIGLTPASRDNHLTLTILCQSIQSTVLVGSELNHWISSRIGLL
jgi:hypothetical protein